MLGSRFYNFNRPVIVAMVAMRMVQPAAHKVIGMIAVRDCFVTAARAMSVFWIMANAAGEFAAAVGIFAAHGNGVLLNVITFRMAQVTVLQISDSTRTRLAGNCRWAKGAEWIARCKGEQ
jgi:hypothetical protein